MKHLFFFSLLFWAPFIQGQSITPELISSTGNQIENGSVFLDYSIGETIVFSITETDYNLTQGYLQPYEVYANVISDEEKETIRVFPNPANDQINILAGNEIIQSITGTDLSGKIISIPLSAQIDISEWTSGIYFLSILTSTQKFQIKIVKI